MLPPSPAEAPAPWDRGERAIVAASLGSLLLFHLWIGGRLELTEDEAYYWVWSQHLAAGYLDHPPAIAWLIAAGTRLLGAAGLAHSELGVRLVPALVGALGLLPAISLAHDRALAAFALVATPLLWLGGALAGPDVPLLAAWSLGLWAAARQRWGWLGLAAGLAMLGKYTGVLLLPLLLLSEPRAALRRGPWVAVALAFAVYLPNALWNVERGLLSWRFQLEHAAGQGAQAGAGSLALLAAQAGLVGPVLFLAALWWGLRHLRQAFAWSDEGGRIDRICWWTSAPVLLLATLTGGEANWAAPAWLGAIVGLARMGGRWSRVAWFGAGLSATLSLALSAHAIHPLFTLDGDPMDRLRGGRVLGESVAAWGISPVYTTRYQEAALIHFYGGVPAHALPQHGRADQYDLWPEPPIPTGPQARVLFVRPYRADAPIPLDDLGWERGGPNLVTAYAPTPDPTVSVPIHRWQVYEAWRPETGGR